MRADDSLSKNDLEEIVNNGPYPIRFPKSSELNQDEEWCEVKINDEWQKIRFHDYNDVYKIPGLYETIFYRTLMCNSPNRVSQLLNEALIELNIQASDLRILDFGAGNGIAGEALQSIGARKVVGIDIIQEAKDATVRDRPWFMTNIKCVILQIYLKMIEPFLMNINLIR